MDPATPTVATNGFAKTPKSRASSARRRRAPQTPYTIRALKRAATPFRRRKSIPKRTPRDELRLLSRALAKERFDRETIREIDEPVVAQTVVYEEEKRTQSNIVVDDVQERRRKKSSFKQSNYTDFGGDDAEIIIPIDDELDEEGEALESSDRVAELEVHRRLSTRDRLSLAQPRLSEGFELPSGLLSVKRDSSSISRPSLTTQDDTVSLIPENSFRIQFDDDDNFEDAYMDFNASDDAADIMNDQNLKGSDLYLDDQTLPLKIPQLRKQSPAKAQTAVPRRVIKDLLKTLAPKTRLTADAFEAVIKQSDAFFDQITSDLKDYATHGRRKNVDAADVALLMRRTRLVDDENTAFALAHKRLPAELLDLLKS